MNAKKILFILSGFITTVSFFNWRGIHVGLSLLLSLGFLIYFTTTKRYETVEQLLKQVPLPTKLFLIAMAAIVSKSVTASLYRSAAISLLSDFPYVALQVVAFIGMVYFLSFYLAWFYLVFSKGIFLTLKGSIMLGTRNKWLVGAGFGLLFFLLLAINQQTPVFFAPRLSYLAGHHPPQYFFFDVIFQTDTDPLFQYYNVFIKDVPSSRQPLFSLFSFPLVAPLYGLGQLLFFVPHLYPTLVMWFQFVLAFLSGALLHGMAKKQLAYPKLFLLFYLSTYALIIFPLILERFIFGLFYLALLIESYSRNDEERQFALLGAMGTNLLSLLMGAFLIVLNEKEKVKPFLKLFGIFIGFMAVFGRLPILFYSGTLADSTRWITFEVGLVHQLMQYSEFVWGSFLFPATAVNFYIYPRYEQAIVTGFHVGGLLIIAACLIAAVRNFEKYLVKVAAFWFGISFLLLGIIGWSANQHNLLLFASFFSFSFIYLFYLFLEQLLSPFTWRFKVLGALAGFILLHNLYGLWDLLSFAFRYYYF